MTGLIFSALASCVVNLAQHSVSWRDIQIRNTHLHRASFAQEVCIYCPVWGGCNAQSIGSTNYVLQVLHSNIYEELKSSLLINNQIHSHNTRTNNQISILRVNRSNTKHCVLHNGMITWNSLPDIFKVNVSFSMLKSKVRNFCLEKY